MPQTQPRAHCESLVCVLGGEGGRQAATCLLSLQPCRAGKHSEHFCLSGRCVLRLRPVTRRETKCRGMAAAVWGLPLPGRKTRPGGPATSPGPLAAASGPQKKLWQ